MPKTVKKDKKSQENDEDDNVPCLYCSGRFNESRQGEEWIRCNMCNEWAHEDCADLCDADFTCNLCKDTMG